MSQSLLSSLHPDALPVAEIGRTAVALTQAIELGVAIAPTAIIPLATLKEIAEANHLADKIERYRRHLNDQDPTQNQVARDSLRKDISRLEIPTQVSSYLKQVYHQQLGGGFISVQASFVTETDLPAVIHHNVKGDANVGESVLAVWAEAAAAQTQRLSLLPAAVILQAEPQPIVSGTLYTAHPQTGNKTRVYLESTWGVYLPSQAATADTFEVDYRTRAVVHSHLGHRQVQWQRSLDELVSQPLPLAKRTTLSLTQSQLKQLADWAITLKQQTLQQLKLDWYLVHDQLLVTSITPVTMSAQEQTGNQKMLVVGDSLIGGYVQGQCVVLPSKTTDFTTGAILVVERLTKSHQGLIRQAAAVITEQAITDSLLIQLIKHYHIPTIVNAKYATRRIQTEQEITVDASGGKVWRLTVDQTLPRTATKLTGIVNNPYTPLSSLADSYYFKSDFSLVHDQLSPPEMVTTAYASTLRDVLVKHLLAMSDKPTWYRLSELHQGQLSATTQDIELKEPNPYFGTRGALFHLHEPAVLYFELGVIKEFLHKTDHSLQLVLPFVRTPGERELLLHLITSRLGEAARQVTFWLELVTPDAVLNLEQYLTDRIAGVILPVDSLYASWHGLDPENPHLLKEYPMNGSFIEQLISYVQSVTHSFMIELKHPHPGQLAVLPSLGVTKLITKSTQLATVKQQLALIEERQLIHGSH